MQSVILRYLTVIGIIALAGFGAYSYGKYVANLERDKIEKVANDKLAKSIKEAAEKHDNDQATINNLALVLAKRLRDKITICPTQKRDQGGASGLAATGVDEAYYRLRDSGTEIIKRCAEMNIDVVETNRSR